MDPAERGVHDSSIGVTKAINSEIKYGPYGMSDPRVTKCVNTRYILLCEFPCLNIII